MNVLILSEEFLKRVFVGLGELPSKFAHEVILDLEAQLKMAEADVKAHLTLVEQHLAPARAKLSLIEGDVKAAAEAAANAAKEIAAAAAAASVLKEVASAASE